MARRTTDETRADQNRCKGSKQDYVPWITVGDISSIGTQEIVQDWIYKRPVHLLSQAESYVYQLLRFKEEVDEIKEQYALPLDETLKIAKKFGIKHPEYNHKPIVMTTDFLVKLKNGSYIAISVKAKESDFKKYRTMEKLLIEKTYWEENNVKLINIAKESIDKQTVLNIKACSYYYDLKSDCDNDITILKHLIIRHLIKPDLTKPLNFKELKETYRYEVELWKTMKLENTKLLSLTTKSTE